MEWKRTQAWEKFWLQKSEKLNSETNVFGLSIKKLCWKILTHLKHLNKIIVLQIKKEIYIFLENQQYIRDL